MVKLLHRLYAAGYLGVSILFGVCGVALLCFAALRFWGAVSPAGAIPMDRRLDEVLETIALLTIAVAAFELAQTILEEEIQREEEMSTPTRVRRFLSRFMIVLVVALSIETLVAVFKFMHDDPVRLLYASTVGFAAAALLVAWGAFVHLNRSAEELEPEAMEHVKREDAHVAAAQDQPRESP